MFPDHDLEGEVGGQVTLHIAAPHIGADSSRIVVQIPQGQVKARPRPRDIVQVRCGTVRLTIIARGGKAEAGVSLGALAGADGSEKGACSHEHKQANEAKRRETKKAWQIPFPVVVHCCHLPKSSSFIERVSNGQFL